MRPRIYSSVIRIRNIAARSPHHLNHCAGRGPTTGCRRSSWGRQARMVVSLAEIARIATQGHSPSSVRRVVRNCLMRFGLVLLHLAEPLCVWPDPYCDTSRQLSMLKCAGDNKHTRVSSEALSAAHLENGPSRQSTVLHSHFCRSTNVERY